MSSYTVKVFCLLLLHDSWNNNRNEDLTHFLLSFDLAYKTAITRSTFPKTEHFFFADRNVGFDYNKNKKAHSFL
jgi:hypothetical protein